jgi:adenine phosphoribosyltransferase
MHNNYGCFGTLLQSRQIIRAQVNCGHKPMAQNSEKLLAEELIRDVPDFPQPGIIFKDITPVLANHAAFSQIVDLIVKIAVPLKPDLIVGIESRGFIFGTPVAIALGIGFAPIRKVGKLPFTTFSEEYALEYGSSIVEMHSDAVQAGQRVIIIDDLLATGGTANAAIRLVERVGGEVVATVFVIELEFLKGRDDLSGYKVESLIVL